MVDSGAGPEVVVAGYASIDYAFRASAPPAVGRTALLAGPNPPPPHFGGCAPNTARELARLGCHVGLVTWLGDDAEGRSYLDTLNAEGVATTGVVVAPGRSTPRCYLFYDPDGGATLYYHPSGSSELRLRKTAHAMVARARVLALTVGPAALTDALLDARSAGTRVAWNVKADPNAYPVALRQRLVRESALLCLNRHELAFVAATLANPPLPEDEGAIVARLQAATTAVILVTAGSAGCRVVWEGGHVAVPAERVDVVDPTGAGDAFFGAFLADWLAGSDPTVAARTATDRVAAMLRARAAGEEAT